MEFEKIIVFEIFYKIINAIGNIEQIFYLTGNLATSNVHVD